MTARTGSPSRTSVNRHVLAVSVIVAVATTLPTIAQMTRPPQPDEQGRVDPSVKPVPCGPWTVLHNMVLKRDVEGVRRELAGGADVNARTRDGATPLMLAVKYGQSPVELVRLLVEAGAELEARDQRGFTAVAMAAEQPNADVTRFLARAGANLETLNNLGMTPLMKVAAVLDLERVKILVEAGARLDTRSSDGETVLAFAARNERREILKYLMTLSPDVNERDDSGMTLLHAALSARDADIASLIANGADVNARASFDQTPLMYAARSGSKEHVGRLLDAGARWADTDLNGKMALHHAAENGHVEAFQRLLEAGASIDTPTAGGNTPLIVAARAGRAEMIRWLLEHGANLEAAESVDSPVTAAVRFCRGNSEAVLEVLSEAGVSMDLPDRHGRSALMVAVESHADRLTCIEWLLRHGASANRATPSGDTPVLLAARIDGRGSAEVLRRLLQAGGDPNAIDARRRNALQLACDKSDGAQKVAILLEAGASPVDPATGRSPALYAAAQAGKLDVFKLLFVAIPDDERVDQAMNAIMPAVNRGHGDIIEWLWVRYAPEPPAKLVLRTWELTLRSGNISLVQLLLKRGVHPDTPYRDGQPPLHFASGSGPVELVQCLLDGAASVDARANDGTTALIQAARRRDDAVRVMAMLIAAGADVNARDASGATALSHAVASPVEDVDRLALLVDAGADVLAGSATPQSAIPAAGRSGKLAAIRYFVGLAPDGSRKTDALAAAVGEAAQKGHDSLLAFLIEQDAPLNRRSLGDAGGFEYYFANAQPHVMSKPVRVPGAAPVGSTPVLWAVRNGHTSTVNVLLGAGADPFLTGPFDQTALMYAARRGNLDLVRRLLDAGLRADALDEYGNNALAHAVTQAISGAIVRTLAEAGADPNVIDDFGRAPLSHALAGAEPERVELVRLLLELGADPSTPGAKEPALSLATRHGRADAVRVLLEAGADIDAVDESRTTALMHAIGHTDLTIAALLLEAGANPNAADQGTRTVAMHAALRNNPDALKLLAQHGANLNVQDVGGQTALILAVVAQRADAIVTLVELGADVKITDRRGQRALRHLPSEYSPTMGGYGGARWTEAQYERIRRLLRGKGSR